MCDFSGPNRRRLKSLIVGNGSLGSMSLDKRNWRSVTGIMKSGIILGSVQQLVKLDEHDRYDRKRDDQSTLADEANTPRLILKLPLYLK